MHSLVAVQVAFGSLVLFVAGLLDDPDGRVARSDPRFAN
jgi:phosphatidylserine synthase